MQIIRVTDPQTERAFIHFPARIYKKCPHWVRPLDQEIKKLFDPSQNSFFEKGEAERWILTNFRGSMIGRIAAYIDRKVPDRFEHPTGGIGFFECIDHQKAAFALFDQCRDWLIKKGMQAMHGPVNLLDPTSKWGLLTEGFSEHPLYGMPYHRDYYQGFFENYGFRLLYKQYNYAMNLQEDCLSPAFQKKASRILSSPDYQVRAVNKQDKENFAKGLMDIYNDAWQDQSYYVPITSEIASNLVKRLSPVIDEKLIYFAYFKEQPIGFFINLPEMNQMYKYMNGKVNFLGRLKYFFGGARNKKIMALMMGVKKGHQGKGVEAALVSTLLTYAKSKEGKYQHIEVAGVSEANPKILHIADKFQMKVSKVYHTYQYPFQSLQKEDLQDNIAQPKLAGNAR